MNLSPPCFCLFVKSYFWRSNRTKLNYVLLHCIYMLFASYFGFDLVIVQIGRSSQNSHWPHALLRLLHDLRFSNFFSSKSYGRKNRSYFGSHTSLEVWSSSVHHLALLSAISFTLFYTSKVIVYRSCDELSILGAIHKRRLLRGGGRGSPLKADSLYKPI